ncbi:MAG: hypothetical protein EBR82_72335, partial [Caulobacteraceae bacterium]|nr:hypothetical protein [Caulobacteraceae bacterium]
MAKSPFEIWNTATKSDAWKSLSPEEQEQKRQAFIAKNAVGDTEEKTNYAKTILNLGTKPIDSLVDDDDFRKAPEELRKKAIKAALIASGQVRTKDFKRSGIFASLPIGSATRAKGDQIVEDKYFELVQQPARRAGLARPFEAIAQTVGAVGQATGLGGEETYNKASEALRQGEKQAALAPTEAKVYEAFGGLSTMVVNPGTFLGRLAANVGLGALAQPTDEATPEGALTQKGISGGISGAVGAVAEGVLNPLVREDVGDFVRTIGAPVSKTAREGTLGRELTEEVKKSLESALRERYAKEAVAAGVKADDVADFVDKKMLTPMAQKRLSLGANKVLNTQKEALLKSDTVYTPAAANSIELQRIQRSAGNLDEILENTIKKKLPEYTKRASATIDEMKANGIVPTGQEFVAPLQIKVYEKLVKPSVVQAAAAKDTAIQQLDKAFTKEQTDIIKTARGGALAAKSNISPKEILKQWKTIASAKPVNAMDVTKGSDAFRVVESLAKKPGNATLTLSDIANIQQRLANDMANSGPAAQSFE